MSIPNLQLFHHFSPESRVPVDHPLRRVKQLADQALGAISGEPDSLSSDNFAVDGSLIEAWASFKSFQRTAGTTALDGGFQRRKALERDARAHHRSRFAAHAQG